MTLAGTPYGALIADTARNFRPDVYQGCPANHVLLAMPSVFEFCLPTGATSVPDRAVWLHEMKYDGYRLRLEREGTRVRLITRGGYNWSDRYPWIVEAAAKNRHRQFVIDGEAVLLTFDGISDFDALHSCRHDELVQLYAFDILVLDNEDLRGLALSVRKTKLARLLARCSEGIFTAPFAQGDIGPDLFIAACDMGLEGMVSKRADRPLYVADCLANKQILPSSEGER
jgi:bifunctional non-homologous end joining protein LigD